MKTIFWLALFLNVVNLVSAVNSTLTCNIKSQIVSQIFKNNTIKNVYHQNENWFTATNDSLVYLINTNTNLAYTFYTKNITLEFGKIRADRAIYFPENDVLVIGGNGLVVIINATINYNKT